MSEKRIRSSTLSPSNLSNNSAEELKSNPPFPMDPSDWQNEQGTLPKCLKYLLDNELSPCIRFVVGDKKETIKAHKIVLGARSPVFYSMFYGPLAQNEEEITLADVQPEGLKRLLR